MYQRTRNVFFRQFMKHLPGMNTILFMLFFVLCSSLLPDSAQACCYTCGSTGWYTYRCCSTAEECGGDILYCRVLAGIDCCAIYPNTKCCIGDKLDPCCDKPNDPCCKNDDVCCPNSSGDGAGGM